MKILTYRFFPAVTYGSFGSFLPNVVAVTKGHILYCTVKKILSFIIGFVSTFNLFFGFFVCVFDYTTYFIHESTLLSTIR